jgi:serine/threonine protein kinase
MRKRIHTHTRYDNDSACEVIGKFQGGNASTFLLHLDDHFFALKVAKDRSRETVEMFQREADNIMHYGGNNAIILFDHSGTKELQEEEFPWILLDYIPSISLHGLLETLRCNSANGERLELCDFLKLKILFSTSYTLRLLHMKGSVHRDVKPHNILIDSNFNTHLCDYSMLSDKPTKSIKGTVNFMPPEFYRESGDDEMIPSNPASDVYAFGGTLLQVITYHWPFDDPKDFGVDILRNYTSKGITDTRFDNNMDMRDIDKDLYEIVKKCWTFEPEKRPTMDEISRQIYRIAENRLTKKTFTEFNDYACSLRPENQELEDDSDDEYEEDQVVERKIKMFPLGTEDKIIEALEQGFGGMQGSEILCEAARFICIDTDDYQEKFKEFVIKYCRRFIVSK